MTNPNTTLIAALLDRSGSMGYSVVATEDGWRELIDAQRQYPGLCYVTLAQFDHEYEVVYPPTDINAVLPFELVPRGNTALLDAAGRFITEVGEQLSALPEERRPGRVICTIDVPFERPRRPEVMRTPLFHDLADALTEIKTVCDCGRKATMNLRVDAAGHAVKQGAQTEIGGNDRYVALCRRHFVEQMRG